MGINRLLALDRPPNGPAEADLAGDLFYALYLAKSLLKDEIPGSRIVNARLLDWIARQAGWTDARQKTAFSIAPAAEATRAIWLHLTDEDVIKEALKKQEEANLHETLAEAALTKAQALREAAQGLREAAEEEAEDGDPAAGDETEDGDPAAGDETEDGDPAAGDETEEDGEGPSQDHLADLAAHGIPNASVGVNDQVKAEAAAKIASAAPPRPEELEAMADQADAEAAAAEAKAKAAQEAAEASLDKIEGTGPGEAAMIEAARDGADKAKDMATIMAGWGIGHSDPMMQDPALVQDLLRKMTPYIKEIARQAGRLKGFVLSAKRERIPTSPSRTEIARTQDPEYILDSEALDLLDKDSPDHAETAAAFFDGGLPGFVPSGDGDREGNAVIMTDISGSMGQTGDQLAKALGLAIAQTKKADGLRYALGSFSDTVVKVVTDKDGPEAHFIYAATRVGAGTNFTAALDKAIEFLGKTPKSDLVFISDGQAPVTEETRLKWEAYKEETGSRLFFVQVGHRSYQGIKDMADHVRHIDDLTRDTAAGLARDFGDWII
jgi:uncharacterized protein with von Willebrand factor type A (vWA) domain